MVPTATLEVKGLVDQYRIPGIGASMGARVSSPPASTQEFQVAPQLRVPATLLLRIAAPRQQLANEQMKATLTAYNIFDGVSVTLGGRRVPLEYDRTATWAVSLAETAIWNTEIAGFLRGTNLDNTMLRLVALEPHRRGRIPVVLVHGTASSPFRWADMVNDLLEVPEIRNRFEFWLFSYPTGNPIPYSAAQLHDAIEEATAALGGMAADPALGHMVLIGHSQGGLLVQMQVIDPGDSFWKQVSRRPFNEIDIDPATRVPLRKMIFPTPLRQVDRVIFIATPHRGAFVAGYSIVQLMSRLVALPLTITKAAAEILTSNADALTFDPSKHMRSTYGMTPGSPLVRALSAIPIVPGVQAHSIIPTLGRGPLEDHDDGVVEYRSAHIDGVESEFVVANSGHSTQSNPLTIAEVQRILLLHAATACPGGTCAPVLTVRR